MTELAQSNYTLMTITMQKAALGDFDEDGDHDEVGNFDEDENVAFGKNGNFDENENGDFVENENVAQVVGGKTLNSQTTKSVEVFTGTRSFYSMMKTSGV